ncbi:zinc-dependent metalloprotease, partial [Streptomyces alboflavus]|uniref:zinc-dependent metalloprotease n=1 Tax=Streptomyces alboflavus TaxID=67267 RepID=UPI0036C55946
RRQTSRSTARGPRSLRFTPVTRSVANSKKLIERFGWVLPGTVSLVMGQAWRGIGGQTLDAEYTESGLPEILIVPRSLSGLRAGKPELYAICSHELTHVAQGISGSRHQVRRAVEMAKYAFADGAEVPDGGSALFEGHATWAHQNVTQALLGQAVTKLAPGRVPLSFLATSLAWKTIPFLRSKKKSYQSGCDFTQYVVDAQGTEFFNQAWDRIELVPAADEISHPQRWIDRLQMTGQDK